MNEGATAEIRHLASLNIDDIPDDPEAVAKLLEVKPEAEKPKEPEAKPEAKAEDKPKEPEAKPDEGAAILAKDGKNLIPHSVLESAREREAEARTAAQAALDKARQLEDEIARLKAGGKPEPDKGKDTAGFLTELDESIAALDGEDGAPALAATLRGLKNVVVDLQGKLDKQAETVSELKADQRAAKDEADREVGQTVTEAIDAIPALAYLRDAADKDPKALAAWNRVANFDISMRESKDPEYLKLSFAERFTKALGATEAAFGKVDVPASYQKAAPAKEKPEVKPKPSQSPEEIEKRAKEELEKAARKPLTLSDLPGGVLPATSEKIDTANMTVAEIEKLFDGKDQEAVDRMLSRM